MVFASINDITIYENLHQDLKKGFEFISAFTELPVGKYEFAKGAYAVVSNGMTKQYVNSILESHRKYIDVHIILFGEETILWQDIEALNKLCEYNAENDVEYYTADNWLTLHMNNNNFCIMLPNDGHKPGICINQMAAYKKVVLKLPL